jgi:hypothetical protein
MRIPIPFVPAALVIRLEGRQLGPPRPRLTIRRLMAAVALIGVWLALASYSERLHRRGSYYAERTVRVWEPTSPIDAGPDGAEFQRLKAIELRYAALSREYHSAADRLDRPLMASLFVASALGVAAGLSSLRWRGRRRPAQSTGA